MTAHINKRGEKMKGKRKGWKRNKCISVPPVPQIIRDETVNRAVKPQWRILFISSAWVWSTAR